MAKKALKLLIKLAISAGFVTWIIVTVNWAEVWTFVKKIEAWQIGLYIAVYMAGILISSQKWKVLADFKEFDYKLGKYFKLYFAGTFINNFMPSFIGGDAFKSYQIGKEGKRYTQALSAVVIDRATGLWGAMILTVVFAIANFQAVFSNKILIAVNGVILFLLILSYLFLRFKGINLIRKFSKFIPQKILEFYEEFSGYNNRSGIITKAILYSFFFSLVGLAAANYILFLSMDIEIGLLNYLSVVFLISIISSLPISINNIGVKEWAYITFFGLFGVGSSAVITVAILSRFLQMLVSFFALPIYLRNK